MDGAENGLFRLDIPLPASSSDQECYAVSRIIREVEPPTIYYINMNINIDMNMNINTYKYKYKYGYK